MLQAVFLTAMLAQGPTETGAFIVRLGTDTLVVERFTRTTSRIDGEYLARSPRTVLRRWTATLAPDGSVRRFTITSTFPGEPARPAATDSVAFSATAPGTLPYLGNSWTLLEQAVRRWRATGAARVTQPMLGPGDDEPLQIGVEGHGADSAVVSIFGNPNVARVDATGRILGVRGFGQVSVERLPRLEIPALATAFANRPLGALSPRDTARGAIGGAHLAVDYSRPSRRGRTIFGGIVPWGQVWRTGANTATTLTTDTDLIFNCDTVPKGQYSLFTIPEPSGWVLIINRAVGQSGTEHDPAQDLARIQMQVETLPEAVEQLTITIGRRERADGAGLFISWDRTRAWVRILAP